MKNQSIRFFVILLLIAATSVSSFAIAPKRLPLSDPGKLNLPGRSAYDYGFQQGVTYSLRNDYAGYSYMLNSYREFLDRYPENADFYNARISGLINGYASHGVPPVQP